MAHEVRPERPDSDEVPVIRLIDAPGEQIAWDRPKVIVYAWAVCELVFVYNPWQVSSRLRTSVLRVFGAEIGPGVIIRPRTRVKFPWKLHLGAHSWIGEGVWLHNQDHIHIGHDVVISQDSFITTGSHRHRSDMALITRPVYIDPGVWITTRCIVLGGSNIGRSALVTPGTVVNGEVPANVIWNSASSDTPTPLLERRFSSDQTAKRIHGPANG